MPRHKPPKRVIVRPFRFEQAIATVKDGPCGQGGAKILQEGEELRGEVLAWEPYEVAIRTDEGVLYFSFRNARVRDAEYVDLLVTAQAGLMKHADDEALICRFKAATGRALAPSTLYTLRTSALKSYWRSYQTPLKKESLRTLLGLL